MDSDEGKLFIGGISWETTEEKLKDHFGSYGEVLQAVVMRDKLTGRPRGFGFVAFADPSVLDRVLQDSHNIDGRTVEAKRALSREEQQSSARSGNPGAGRPVGGGGGGGEGGGGGGSIRTKKIFVGGLPPTLTEDEFKNYFMTYGHVADGIIMYDQNTKRPRGFGFISFDSEDAVDRVLHKNFHELNNKLVEVKRALPRDANPVSGGGRSTGCGAYQSYGGSGGNTSSYDSRMDANRYMQQQPPTGGYPSYGSSAYGGPGYGYGTANNGVNYGGYSVPSYGGAAAGYGGAAGAYGNPNASAGGYMGGPPNPPRNMWSNQPPSAYGTSGYGANTGYGMGNMWNAPGGGSGGVAAPTGQSPGNATGYGSQGYGYGGYGATEGGSHGSQGGYGAVGGRGSGGPTNNPAGGSGDQGIGSGYMGGSYGEPNGNMGYSNAWNSDPSQGGGYGSTSGPAAYGSAYGGVQSRQAQQQ